MEAYYNNVNFFGPVAQWIEQLPSKQWVVGSIPARATKKNSSQSFDWLIFFGSPAKRDFGLPSLMLRLSELIAPRQSPPGLLLSKQVIRLAYFFWQPGEKGLRGAFANAQAESGAWSRDTTTECRDTPLFFYLLFFFRKKKSKLFADKTLHFTFGFTFA